MHSCSRNIVLPALVLVAAACSGTDLALTSPSSSNATALSSQRAAVATVAVTPNLTSVAVGDSVRIGITMKDTSGNVISSTSGVQVHWSSSDTAAAQVTQSGSVIGRKNGIVTITASADGISGTSTVTVDTGNKVTATTTPTSTTSTTSTLAGSGLSGVAFSADDFTHYHSTTDLRANISSLAGGTGNYKVVLYNDGANAQLVSLDTAVRYNGHATMRYDQPGGIATTPTLHHVFPAGTSLTKMWLRAKIRFSPGYTTTGTLTNSANAYKMLGWGWSGFNGRGSLEISNTNQYLLYWYVFNTSGQTIAGGNDSPAGNISTEWSSGQWYDYIIEYEQTDSTDAVARVWFQPDGTTPTLRAVTTGSGPVGTIPSVNSVFLGLNFNQVRTATQSQSVWYGEWEVIDGVQHPDPYGLGVR